MNLSALQTEVSSRTANHRLITERVVQQPELIPEVLAGLSSQAAPVKYGCLKVLRLASEREPAILYPHFEQFAKLLGSENTILNWGAIIILGNLASADRANKFDALISRYLKPIRGPVMITAANTVGGAAKVAIAAPHLSRRITSNLLRVETANYQTEECRNVVLGHVLQALELIFRHERVSPKVVAFAQRQLRNPRKAVRLKASRFLKRHAADAVARGEGESKLSSSRPMRL